MSIGMGDTVAILLLAGFGTLAWHSSPKRISAPIATHISMKTSPTPALSAGVLSKRPPHMIKTLKLVPMRPLDPEHADSIFKNW